MAIMVGAGYAGDRAAEPGQADLLPPRLGHAEGFEAAADVLAGDNLLAGDALSVADCLGAQHRIVDAAIIVILADFILGNLAQAFVDDVFDDILDRRKVCPDAVEIEGGITLSLRAGGACIVFAARIPDADEVIHGEADLGSLLDGGRVHGAPTPHDHPGRSIASHAEPLRRLALHLLHRDRIHLDLEAVILGELLEQRDRLATVAAFEEDVTDGLAPELVEPALLAADVFEN